MDIAGRYFGLLKVKRIYQIKDSRTWWKCECYCGSIIAAKAEDIVKHKVEDCGCISENYSNIITLQKSKVKQIALSDIQVDINNINNKENKENEKAGINMMENSVGVKEAVNGAIKEGVKEEVKEAAKEEVEPIIKTDAMIGKRFGSLVVW